MLALLFSRRALRLTGVSLLRALLADAPEPFLPTADPAHRPCSSALLLQSSLSMCPFRVLVILFSLLIALFATMAALAKDPEEEEREALARGEAPAAKKSAWALFVDFWTGRYLYRESKRLMPWFFSKDEEEEQEIGCAGSASCHGDELAAAVAEAEAILAEQQKQTAAEAQQLLLDQPGQPEPSAPEADVDAALASSPVADAAFERALSQRRAQQQPMLRSAGMAAVIS